jgi:NAD(P)-dependent dehydrogenase (short-subunit alcohol dehydrogenase family)
MSGLLEARVVLVIGGASGIGRATALTAAAEGAKVVVADLDDDGARIAADLITEQGGEGLSLPVDVTDTASVDSLVEQAVRHFGRLDVAVNSAGVTTSGGHFHEAAESDLDRISAVNAHGVFRAMRAELRQFRLQESTGVIINVAGSEGLIGVPLFAIESACTHAVIGLTKTAALEFAAAGIRVNAVCPSAIETDLFATSAATTPPRSTPLQRTGTPQEVANAIVWLACDRSSFITGEALQIDGGVVEAEGQLHPG